MSHARVASTLGDAFLRSFSRETFAEDFYETSLRLDPDNAAATIGMARVRARQGRVESARRRVEGRAFEERRRVRPRGQYGFHVLPR